jgi:hypothetical protein
MTTTGLDRQRAGYVQPEPEAYSIPGIIAEIENNNNNNNNNVTSSEASSVNATIPDATTTNASSLSTTTALTATVVSTVDHRSSLDNPLHEGRGDGNNTTRGGSSGDRLIEAELVTVPICAPEVVPIDEENERCWLISVVVFVLIIFCIVPTTIALKIREKPLTNKERYGYDCFNTITNMIRAQIDDFVLSKYTKTNDRYTICPGTNVLLEFF